MDDTVIIAIIIPVLFSVPLCLHRCVWLILSLRLCNRLDCFAALALNLAATTAGDRSRPTSKKRWLAEQTHSYTELSLSVCLCVFLVDDMVLPVLWVKLSQQQSVRSKCE